MKKIYYILGIALFIISVCMIYLVKQGVSLRTEPIIKPSPLDPNYKNLTSGVLHRMFPEFQKADYILWGINPDSESEDDQIFKLLIKSYESMFGYQLNIIKWSNQLSPEQLKKCIKPCWIQIEKEKANSLLINESLRSIQSVLGLNYFSFTFLNFQRDTLVDEQKMQNCNAEKRLDYDCVLPISVREVRKYFKKSDIKYFFTRRYNSLDYFLFIEK